MLSRQKAYPTVAVKDMAAARKFYEKTLGLKEFSSEGRGFVAYATKDSLLFVYKSRFAGSTKATLVTWIVEDLDREVEDLRRRGVTFEHYDMPGMTVVGDIHVGRVRVAYFQDPDGNLHSVTEE